MKKIFVHKTSTPIGDGSAVEVDFMLPAEAEAITGVLVTTDITDDINSARTAARYALNFSGQALIPAFSGQAVEPDFSTVQKHAYSFLSNEINSVAGRRVKGWVTRNAGSGTFTATIYLKYSTT